MCVLNIECVPSSNSVYPIGPTRWGNGRHLELCGCLRSDSDLDDVFSFVKGDVNLWIHLSIQRVPVRAEGTFKMIPRRLG